MYELSDHLGNVRALISKGASGEAVIEGYSDYYPFGWKMPNRNTQGSDRYRYGYQGQFAEEDSDVNGANWNQFELRSYDARLGRWMTVDPAGQYASPYLGMGNDPINGVDPDGGYTQFLDADGNVVYDDKVDNGIIYQLNDGYAGSFVNVEEMIANSMLLVSEGGWLGTDQELIQYIYQQAVLSNSEVQNIPTKYWKLSHNLSVNDASQAGLGVAIHSIISTEDGFVKFNIKKRKNWRFNIYRKSKDNIILRNVYNLRNTLGHEGNHFWLLMHMARNHDGVFHFSGSQLKTMGNALRIFEVRAVEHQKTLPSWDLTTDKFKNSVNNYGKKHFILHFKRN